MNCRLIEKRGIVYIKCTTSAISVQLMVGLIKICSRWVFIML